MNRPVVYLEKFDASQARDENGRWTDGGAGGGAGSNADKKKTFWCEIARNLPSVGNPLQYAADEGEDSDEPQPQDDQSANPFGE